MTEKEMEELLESENCGLDCLSPLEISSNETGDTATGWLAQIVLDYFWETSR